MPVDCENFILSMQTPPTQWITAAHKTFIDILRFILLSHGLSDASSAMNRSVAPFSRSLQSSTDYGALNSAPLESLLSVVFPQEAMRGSTVSALYASWSIDHNFSAIPTEFLRDQASLSEIYHIILSRWQRCYAGQSES